MLGSPFANPYNRGLPPGPRTDRIVGTVTTAVAVAAGWAGLAHAADPHDDLLGDGVTYGFSTVDLGGVTHGELSGVVRPDRFEGGVTHGFDDPSPGLSSVTGRDGRFASLGTFPEGTGGDTLEDGVGGGGRRALVVEDLVDPAMVVQQSAAFTTSSTGPAPLSAPAPGSNAGTAPLMVDGSDEGTSGRGWTRAAVRSSWSTGAGAVRLARARTRPRQRRPSRRV